MHDTRHMGDKESEVSLCGVPEWFGLPENSTASYVNDIFVAVFTALLCCFAICSNLLIIVTTVKTPSLQKPCNILLCSLAAADWLTGLTSMPMFAALRLIIHRVPSTCSYQEDLFTAFYASIMLTSGWSFAILTFVSFDRLNALSRPISYRLRVTVEGTVKTMSFIGVSWFLLTILAQLLLSSILELVFSMTLIAIFIIIPTVNHIRMYLAIRRHNKELRRLVASVRLTTVLRREKKTAIDMFVITMVLLLCLVPAILIKSTQVPFPRVYSFLQPWSIAMVFSNSALNPLIYTLRNQSLRDAMRNVILRRNRRAIGIITSESGGRTQELVMF
ncbi:hypothetical protein pdam_00003986 [Pocillopora damicornis]|uniref:G-protein coupled receptors family 1 profile domain-containing protein n=1 Tax=Pocillopora damicornis TaxID=46731 RepID=A0A3M6TE25_POCDA|nr:hypothetical protein pdam_00003986 [Pocillopora damicornis]